MASTSSSNPIKPIKQLDPKTRSLVKEAMIARKKAYAPYSKYLVGCALVDKRGRVYTGCNVENASYPAGLCAERTAIVKMVSDGGKAIQHLVLVASSLEPVLPCGMCLQVIQEFGPKCRVTSVNPKGTHFREFHFGDLFPFAFTPEKLRG
jgi:cytidine deaminase